MPEQSHLFPEARIGKGRNPIRCARAIATLARRLWPAKTALQLASRTGVTQRAAELWLDESNNISADALVALLRSDAGYDVLQELMTGTTTQWWREFERGVRIRDIETKIEFQRRALSALKAELSR